MISESDEPEVVPESETLDTVFHSVGRGAAKLKSAMKAWDISAEGLCIDVGASTGGFTQILLEYGAQCVLAVDVGKNQLSEKLRRDPRVISLEQTDIRTLRFPADLPEKIRTLSDATNTNANTPNTNARNVPEDAILRGADFIVCDVSFISVTKILPSICNLLKNEGKLILLIKPQFELPKRRRMKNGVVREEKDRREAVEYVIQFARESGLYFVDVMESPVKGGDGNTEYLAYFRKERREV